MVVQYRIQYCTQEWIYLPDGVEDELGPYP